MATEIVGVVHGDSVLLPVDVHIPEGTRVRAVVDDIVGSEPLEPTPLAAADVEADLGWAARRRTGT